jgi:AraC family transcriptional regulator
MDEMNPLPAAAEVIEVTPPRHDLLRFLPNRRELFPDGTAMRRPASIEEHSAAASRNTCAHSTETPSSQVLSLPRTGGRETPNLPGGFADAGTWAGDASSPAQFSPRSATILALPHAKGEANAAIPALQISPGEVARRQGAAWGLLAGEVIQVTQPGMFEARFCAPAHLLIAAERGERHEGETFVEGLPRSSLRNMSQKLTFVPAGHKFHDWQDPRILPRLTCLYLDPRWSLPDDGPDLGGLDLAPRLFFHDADLWATARKLTRQIERSDGADRLYVDALGLVLLRELLRLGHAPAAGEPVRPGGLADWQSRRTAEYIEAHLGDRISLATLAAIARLSPYHFARAFKRSFGVPPHRYHTARRIERAKTLLARPALSITEIALELGFGETSSFTAAFRRLVGRTPSSYRRSLS